tara:strand:+ start:604 stop:1062 length:459 start_codon:yes stop_codon:yes gene_type:complete
MKNLRLKNKLISASCDYCGSADVGIDRSPFWDAKNLSWEVPEVAPYENYAFKYERKNEVTTPFTRAYCDTCKGDTRIRFDVMKTGEDFESASYYHARITERIPLDNGSGGWDTIFYDHSFESLDELEQKLSVTMWDQNCDVKISKVFKEEIK